ncbi:MAG: FMN-binding protein [Eubacteriaceae bacterium]|nr:FMN-binding protein [Eubacteriaceae bacterium]
MKKAEGVWQYDAIPQAIIAAQNPVVNTVSGATYTSNGIRQAVLNALDTAELVKIIK